MSKLYNLIIFIFVSVTITTAQTPLNVDFQTSNLNPAPGSQVEIDVIVNNYDNIAGAQFGILWDSLVLSYNSVTNVTTDLPELVFNEAVGAVSSISTPVNQANGFDGFVFFSWSRISTEAFTLPNGTRLFTIVMDAIGQPCDGTGLTVGDDPNNQFRIIEVFDGNFEFIDLESNELDFVLEGPGCGGGMGSDSLVTYLGGPYDACVNEQFCYPVKVENFEGIVAFQGSMQFDTNALKFDTLININTDIPNIGGSNFNLTGVDTAGRVGWLWFDQFAVPISFDDGTTLFEVCFDVCGEVGDMTSITYVDQPVSIEFADVNSMPLDFNVDHADITFVDTGCDTVIDPPKDPFTICILSDTVALDGEACFDFVTSSFDSIGLFQFNVFWDPAVLTYGRETNLNTTLNVNPSGFNLLNPGQLRVTWNSQSGSVAGVSVPDNSVLFTLCLDATGGCNDESVVEIADDAGVSVEIAKGDNTVVEEYILKEGNAFIACGIFCESMITHPTCAGDFDGTIICDLMGGQEPYSCSWVDGNNNPIATNTCSLIGQPAGNYVLTVVDAAGVMEVFNYDLIDPDPVVVEGMAFNGDCIQGGRIEITCEGGTGNITCVWSGPGNPIPDNFKNPTGLITGNYTVVCTDENGCSDSETFFVQVLGGGETAAVQVVKNADCISGGELRLTTNIVNGTISWSPPVNAPLDNPSNLPANTYSVTVTDPTTGCFAVADAVITQAPEINVDGTFTNAGCTGGGSIDITITNNVDPPTITWSDASFNGMVSLPNLPADTYTVTVTDPATGCTDTESFMISDQVDPINIALDVTSSSVVCFGDMTGAATVTISGGCDPVCTVEGPDPSVTYDCANLTNLAAGMYTVTANDGMNSTFVNFTIEGPASALSATAEIIDSAMMGMPGTIEIAAAGGWDTGYTYMWTDGNGAFDMNDNGSFTLPVECYELKVTDANGCEFILPDSLCVVEKDTVVSNPLLVVEDPMVSTDFNGFGVSCNGSCNAQATMMISNGVPPFTITYEGANMSSQEVTANVLGIVVLDNLCGDLTTITTMDAVGQITTNDIVVLQPDPISVVLNEAQCADEGESNGFIDVTASSDVEGIEFLWSSGGTNSIEENLPVGNYFLDLTDANGCTERFLFDELSSPCIDVPVEDCYKGSTVITPNGDGANDFFRFANCGDDVLCIDIFDRYGKRVYFSADYNSDWNGTNTAGAELPEGAYFYVIVRKRLSDQDQTYKGTVSVLR